MARKIKDTPTLYGKDAEKFLNDVKENLKKDHTEAFERAKKVYDKVNEDNCAFLGNCKGICSSPSSCRRAKMTDEEYWKEIRQGIIAKERLDRIYWYLSTNPKIVRTNILLQMATIPKRG